MKDAREIIKAVLVEVVLFSLPASALLVDKTLTTAAYGADFATGIAADTATEHLIEVRTALFGA
jgi:hypothetical protein